MECMHHFDNVPVVLADTVYTAWLKTTFTLFGVQWTICESKMEQRVNSCSQP